MGATLTPEQKRAVAEAGVGPVRVEDPETGIAYVLIPEVIYEFLRATRNRPAASRPPMTRTLDRVVGSIRGVGPPPDDEECERIVEEERMKKYG